jgi:molybdate/tungstate transport system substrate-binding protein
MSRFLNRVMLLILVLGFSACAGNKKDEKKVIIFHAGSLSMPFREIAAEYMKLNPGVKIQMEAAGSVECARKITELKKPCDIMASADYYIIDEMLIPEYASWNISFAANSMVIAYTSKSRLSGNFSRENWIDILLDGNIIYGRSDPNSDPCGYRTLLTLQLAEKYYNRPGLAGQLSDKDRNMIRPKEVDLLALLESNAIDYIFIYKSVALQHNLNYLELPPEINLSDPGFEDRYNQVSVEITGNSPGDFITVRGSKMIYGITLLDNAPNREEAIDFLVFLLGEPGLSIMKQMGQGMDSLPFTGSRVKLPPELAALCIEEQN